MSSLNNRVQQLEKQQIQATGTWRDFITGAWQPQPHEWAAFLALQRPSDIAASAEQLLEQGCPATDEQRAALESMKQEHDE